MFRILSSFSTEGETRSELGWPVTRQVSLTSTHLKKFLIKIKFQCCIELVLQAFLLFY